MPRDFGDAPPLQPRGGFWDFDRLDPATRARIERQLADPAALHWSELGALNATLGQITMDRARRAKYAAHLLAFKTWK